MSTIPLPIAPFERIFNALSFGISWITLPDARICYSNNAFDCLFGFSSGHFESIDIFIETVFIHEHQREQAHHHWQGFNFRTGTDIITIPDMEVDIINNDGSIKTVLHSGLILNNEKLALFMFKDISEITHQNKMLRDFAFHDPLTGVFNRRGLQERWREESACLEPQRLVFLMLDLDGFKPVNDTHGHDVGDEVLRVVALRLKAAIRDSDLVCRLGGDEFGLLLTAPERCEGLATICERIIGSLAKPIQIGEHSITISSSIGGCLYPDQATNKRELLQRADLALYEVKQNGKGHWGWYSDGKTCS